FEDGYINDPALLGKELDTAIKNAGMKARHVVFSLASNRIASRDVIIPRVKPNKIMPLLTANASEYFPVDVSNYKMGYNILETTPGENGEDLKLLVIAIPNDLIKTYYKLADALGLKLQALDYIGNALVGITSPIVGEAPAMVVKIGDSSSVITIFKNKRPILHRNVAYGVYDALDTIMDSKKLELMDAINDLRQNNYFGENPGGPDLREDLDMLANGIARVADYHNSRNEEKLHEIILTGFASDFKGLSELVAEITGLETRVLELNEGISLSAGDFVGNYVTAIGAAINPIDFTLTDSRGKKRKQKAASLKEARRARILYLLSAGCLLVALALTGVTLLESWQENRENMELTDQREELLPVVAAFNSYQETLGLYNEVTHIFDLTKNRNEELRAFVEELEDVIPSNAFVSSFASDGRTATLSFTCTSKEEAGNLIERLRNFNSVLTVTVTGISESRDELSGVQTVQFSATLTYRPVGEDAGMEETEETAEEETSEEETSGEESAEDSGTLEEGDVESTMEEG
ncbi:MAG: pilus assembly protein PilM, partial [Lachnospiraceae bacterium]|nr:pilus assembly protein PilM [Lachnospiraceae bacterium]